MTGPHRAAARPWPAPARGGAETPRRLKAGSLFSGFGGLDLAVEDVFDAETVWFAETDPAAARIYERHWPGVPNLGDVSQVDWSQVAPVDILCGGPPCQDLSYSGRMAGLGSRTRSGLFWFMAAAAAALRPSWVVIENVPGLLAAPAGLELEGGEDGSRRGNPDGGGGPGRLWGAVRGLGPPDGGVDGPGPGSERAMGALLSALAGLGFDAVWARLPASAAGACHLRRRVFVLAWPAAVHPVRL
ncbi:MAG: DNA cytosine methyltransferase [Bifidobacteriaceae bacterium]|nr:DNA cytosine methyltransferase [Bifidobacteriaceae bacterium]